MSRGIGLSLQLIEKDDTWAVYQYAPFNLNYLEYRNPDYRMDGRISIKLESLPIIEFHKRNSKKSGKTKGQIKKVVEKFTSKEMLESGFLIIENSRYCWKKYEDTNIDAMAFRAVWRLIWQYESNGEIPEKLSFFS